jgi:nitroreductase/NAD-dependent dihydropyrimidine dehydrogenase PreA subunit
MIQIDATRCSHCGLCIPVCFRRILQERDGAVTITDPDLCRLCGHCKAVCPTDAIRFAEGNEDFDPAPPPKEIPSPGSLLRFFRRRRSHRSYQNRAVEKEKLLQIVEAGRFAPTGGNRQACQFVIIGGRKTLDRVCTLAIQILQDRGAEIRQMAKRSQRLREPMAPEDQIRQHYLPVWERMAAKWGEGVDQLLHQAPALVLIHMKENLAVTPELDAGMAAEQMVLMAEALELGTCYIGFLIMATERSAALKELVKIPADHRALVAFTVGYPAARYLRLVSRHPAPVQWLGSFA